MNLRVHRLAVAEIDHEVDYYESRQAGLGVELEDEIDAAFSLIVQFPDGWPYSTAFRFGFLTRSHPK
jgi:hypothetical protein